MSLSGPVSLPIGLSPCRPWVGERGIVASAGGDPCDPVGCGFEMLRPAARGTGRVLLSLPARHQDPSQAWQGSLGTSKKLVV